MYFVAERDVHMGTLRALKMPIFPPDLRRELKVRGGGRWHSPHSPETTFHQVDLLGGAKLQRVAARLAEAS